VNWNSLGVSYPGEERDIPVSSWINAIVDFRLNDGSHVLTDLVYSLE
jgi:hypothetical protein